jgi:hypothetical protein
MRAELEQKSVICAYAVLFDQPCKELVLAILYLCFRSRKYCYQALKIVLKFIQNVSILLILIIKYFLNLMLSHCTIKKNQVHVLGSLIF